MWYARRNSPVTTGQTGREKTAPYAIDEPSSRYSSVSTRCNGRKYSILHKNYTRYGFKLQEQFPCLPPASFSSILLFPRCHGGKGGYVYLHTNILSSQRQDILTRLGNVPGALWELPRWLLWRYEKVPGQLKKPP